MADLAVIVTQLVPWPAIPGRSPVAHGIVIAMVDAGEGGGRDGLHNGWGHRLGPSTTIGPD